MRARIARHGQSISESLLLPVTIPRIAINGRFLTQKIVGVQRFASETVKAMDRLLAEPRYAALRGRLEIVAPRNARDCNLANIPMRRGCYLTGYAWEQIEFPLLAPRSVLLNLCLLGPVIKQKQIIVVHDTTVRAMPDNFSWKFRIAYNVLLPLLLRSDLVVSVSDFSRRELGKYFGVDIARIPVCHEGADHITAIDADTGALERFGLTGRKFLLGVGVGSSNKNIENVLAAFQRAKLDDTLLVLTGKRDASVHGRLVNIDSAGVRNVGFVSDAELRALYENALALVYPSRYEGFGLPPIEAMQCGCPVIVSDQEALLEVGGDAVLSCGMDDVDGLARLMRQIHADGGLRGQLKARGRERVRQFTWQSTARILLDLCLQVGSRRAA
jgi:glycosyltransferase involved in cell wall biosynthesis